MRKELTQRMRKGSIIVVSAPSGCGKGTLLAEVMKKKDFVYSVSATTRSPRPNETDGKDYRFMQADEFKRLIAEDGMLEYAEYCGNFYGTPKDAVIAAVNEGRDIILEIEVQGAAKIREKCPEAVFLFILPPSLDALKSRLVKRGTETSDVIDKRVAQARREIAEAYKYDYVIVNDDLECAVSDFLAAVTAAKLETKKNRELIDGILKENTP